MNQSEFEKRLNQRGMFRIKPGLDRIRAVLRHVGNPQDTYPTIHVAGTNGKGSVAAAIESVCRQAGYKTGFYLSPHLEDLRERIQISGQPVFSEAFMEAARVVSEVESTTCSRLTYFEYLTAMAFIAFKQARVDLAIVEVGLGGLWDATNAIRQPSISVITSIGLDHVQWLGSTRSAIARQKAGIIKIGSRVISGVRGSPGQVIEKVALDHQAPLTQIGRDFGTQVIETHWETAQQVFRYRTRSEDSIFEFGLMGAHQADNAALAVTAIRHLQRSGWRIRDQHLRNGLNGIFWPCRFSVIRRSGQGPILLDGAHNPEAMRSFIRTLRQSPWSHVPKTLVFSAYSDKNYPEMARLLEPLTERIYVCQLPNSRGLPAADLATAFKGTQKPVVMQQTPKQALHLALAETPPDHLLMITGSLALVGMLWAECQAVQKPMAQAAVYA